MRVAFVIQRYGSEVHGGSEYLCRMWAERLAQRHQVAVLTTCARDYLTWADYYPPGEEMLNGVHVQRYPVAAPRDMAAFDALSQTLFGQADRTEADEIEWMRQQGPYAPALFAAIADQQQAFDLFVFMTYLYCSTFFGLPAVQHKAVLVPTAHDEFSIYLGIFRQVFHAPRAIIYLTAAERSLVQRLFGVAHIPASEVGIGVELPAQSLVRADNVAAAEQPPLLLYIGRIHPSKGCDELYEYMVRYLGEHAGAARLVLVGRADMQLADHPQITYTGFVDEETKTRLLHQCSLLIIPSPHESLSIVTLEAWAAGKPVLANGHSAVLREQSMRSNGGLLYTNYDEFAACLRLLLERPPLRHQLGQQGRAFVQRWYSWPAIEQQLETALQQARQHSLHETPETQEKVSLCTNRNTDQQS